MWKDTNPYQRLFNGALQEAVDQMAQIKQHQQQLDAVKAENRQLRELDNQREDIQVSFRA